MNNIHENAKSFLQLQKTKENDTRNSMERAQDTLTNTKKLSEVLQTGNKQKVIDLINQLPENQVQEIGQHIAVMRVHILSNR